jgi:hypothetical protein
MSSGWKVSGLLANVIPHRLKAHLTDMKEKVTSGEQREWRRYVEVDQLE